MTSCLAEDEMNSEEKPSTSSGVLTSAVGVSVLQTGVPPPTTNSATYLGAGLLTILMNSVMTMLISP